MKYTVMFCAASCLATVAGSFSLADEPAKKQPIEIGSRLELLLDDYVIERLAGKAGRRFQQPVQREVVMVFDRAWEGNSCGYVTVFRDGERFRMYYRGSGYTGDNPAARKEPAAACLAESSDGIHWNRPELGLYDFSGSKKNNIVWMGLGAEEFTPMLDANPKCHPEQRYKAFGHGKHELYAQGKGGLYAFKSADGIRWSLLVPDRPVITSYNGFDSQNLAFWDTTRNRYVSFFRHWRKWGTRDIGTCTSLDFLKWTDAAHIEYEGWKNPDENLYTNAITPYFRAPHVFVGFPMRYVPSRANPGRDGRAEELSDAVFISSRDGLRFQRPHEAFLRPGPSASRWATAPGIKPGVAAHGNNCIANGILLTKPDSSDAPDELSLYSIENYGGRGPARLRRHTLRLDGFASIGAPFTGGELITRPIRFAGDRLLVNASTSAVGGLRVEIQDGSGKPIEGFTLEDSLEMFGDDVKMIMKWKTGQDVGRLAGQPVRLRFVFRDADLFSFRFQPATGAGASSAPLRSFAYNQGQLSPVDGLIRVHETSIPAARGTVHLYATSAALGANPVSHIKGKLQGSQRIVVGQKTKGEFVPAIRFGVADSGRGPAKDQTLLCIWANDGKLDHFGDFARPETPCDFKLMLDLDKKTATVWTSRRGDDRWFLLLDAAPIDPKVTAIDTIRVEQHPGAPGFNDVVVQGDRWPEGEAIRPHPLAKKTRTVVPDSGFRFQPMRSTWRTGPGRHVTIARDPPIWFGFPEVVHVGEKTLVVTHNDGRQHGGGGGLFIRRSEDLGQTWGEPVALPVREINCPRLQVLKDSSLLLLADIGGAVGLTPLFRSEDAGKNWKKIGELDAAKAGGHAAIVPSPVHEQKDGSWLIVGSWYPGGKPWEGKEGEQLEIFRSTDRGATWKFHANLQAYPEHRHSLSEASFLTLPDGRLMLFAREGRGDGFPGIKAFSKDGGKTWDVQSLPFAITGRTHAGFLPDGRVMLTFRSGIGRQALWAWIGDPLEKPQPSAAAGIHFNDSRSVALKDDALHIDNDGRRGQFTQYLFRPPSLPDCSLEIRCEAKVQQNQGQAAIISIPFAGKLSIFPDRVQLHTTDKIRHPPIAISTGEFHAYHVIVGNGKLRLMIDGQEKLTTDQLDVSTIQQAWTPARPSNFGLGFGNERQRNWANHDQAVVHPDMWEPNITFEVTGYSIWRSFEAVVQEPKQPEKKITWNAKRDGFPDQYQLDHIVEIEASVAGHDQGYSGWTLLPDGRIFVVNYTDDTAPLVNPGLGGGNARMGVSWIRGTHLSPKDLPVKAR